LRVFLAGATGVLGRRLVRLLCDQGNEVAALARSPEKADWLRRQGAEPHQVSLFDADQLAGAADGCETVVHAATAIPRSARTSPRDWAENDRIRREGTRALAECAAKIGARAYVQQSVVWVARPADGSFFDEDAPFCGEPLMQSAFDGERRAAEAGEKHGFAVSVLRCGWFYGDDAAYTQMFRDGLQKRRVPIIGKGDALWACLHLDDAAQAFLTAIEHPQSGVWHVVDDQPVAVADFLGELASLLGAKPPRRVPVWLARLLAGKQAVEFFTHSTQTSNQRFRRQFGWSPQYTNYREGLRQVVETWNTRRPD
jgi:nucleoside-diphosphate-sugar epimerase